MGDKDEKVENGDKKQSLGVTPTQVSAGALAAVSASALGAQFGTAGTIWGAGLASVITTIGAAVYQHSFDRTKDKAKKIAKLKGATPDAKAALARMKERPVADPSVATPQERETRTQQRSSTSPTTAAAPPAQRSPLRVDAERTTKIPRPNGKIGRAHV